MVQETTLYEGQHGGSEFSDGIISTRYAFFTRKEFLVYISFWGRVFSYSGRHTLAGSLRMDSMIENTDGRYLFVDDPKRPQYRF